MYQLMSGPKKQGVDRAGRPVVITHRCGAICGGRGCCCGAAGSKEVGVVQVCRCGQFAVTRRGQQRLVV